MEIKLSFLGAVQNVTGSRHLVEVNGIKVLVDCGLYQERHFLDRNWDPFPVAASSINAVLLTHAHLDHCGLLPKLVREGFKGKIHCTKATAELAKIILLDSARLQEEDAEYKRKRHVKQNRQSPRPIEPLYTQKDAEACFSLFSCSKYKQTINLADGVEAILYDAGHVLGSSVVRLKVNKNGQERIILFSGDIGRPNRPIICDPAVFDKADYVLIESTYGDRVHQDVKNIKEIIADIINSTLKAGGNIIVPSFALERSQEILYYMNELLLENKIPLLDVFLDSPMASKMTKVFQDNAGLYDAEMTEFVNNHNSPFKFPTLHMAGSVDESKAINNIKKPIMVIAGSGMCNGGRIKHHLVNNITHPESTIMFVGYQAMGTLGRIIVDGAKEVRILGETYPVNARIAKVQGFSAHADKEDLLKWLKELKSPPRKIFVVHGESESAKSFGNFVKQQTGWNVMVPEYKNSVVLD